VVPRIVHQLNLFIDGDGIVRTNCKFQRLNAQYGQRCPLLLDRNSPLTTAILQDIHVSLLHGGLYKVLAVLRKDFYVPRAYTTVRKFLSTCVFCKRLHGRAVKINTNDYCACRINPDAIPFRQIILDYIGPFDVKNINNVSDKVYILIFSCYWSRAINLFVCNTLDTGGFLRALQMQIFDYGVPSMVCSDNGTQIVQGIGMLQNILKEKEVVAFLKERNVAALQFQPYPAGTSKLGGAIESLVKQVKNLLRGAYGKNILHLQDFEFLVKKVNCLINKRPIAFKNVLSNSDPINNDTCITPEMLIKGYETPSLSLLPQISENLDEDFILNKDIGQVWEKSFRNFSNLNKVRTRLNLKYMPEFLSNLQHQASNLPSRYAPHSHTQLRIGDLVSIKEQMRKPFDFPRGVIVAVETNSADEIPVVSIRKANHEVIRRHVEEVILLLRGDPVINTVPGVVKEQTKEIHKKLPRRRAAVDCEERNRLLLT
jgi:hypothetical protein